MSFFARVCSLLDAPAFAGAAESRLRHVSEFEEWCSPLQAGMKPWALKKGM